jgi:phenol/toluene 2-monooxygenase (NADH) P4/A4
MGVVAITPDYEKYVEIRDRRENFHGNIVVYLHWEQHLSFCAALAFPLPPDMPFGAMVENVLKPHYAAHPDFAKIDWAKVSWDVDGAKRQPALDKSLAENGVGHKSLIRFWTPGLNGWQGSAS